MRKCGEICIELGGVESSLGWGIESFCVWDGERWWKSRELVWLGKFSVLNGKEYYLGFTEEWRNQNTICWR